jgi:hypothetical protein
MTLLLGVVRGQLRVGRRQDARDAVLPGQPSRAVQVDPIKPTLKAPVYARLSLEPEKPLRSFASNFIMRRCSLDWAPPELRKVRLGELDELAKNIALPGMSVVVVGNTGQGLTPANF